jgi:Glyoxalase/Bleomycin resistance protein/Dioxygenase superfamily
MTAPVEPAYQMAFLVDALEPTIEFWHAQTGAGPFFVIPHFDFEDARYKDAPSDLDISIALGYCGDIMIELIVCHSAGPSPFAHLIAQPKPILHHVARLTDDFPAALARLPTADFTATFPPSTRMAYVDTRATIGCFTEIIANTPELAGMQAAMRAATQGWDGTAVMRSF